MYVFIYLFIHFSLLPSLNSDFLLKLLVISCHRKLLIVKTLKFLIPVNLFVASLGREGTVCGLFAGCATTGKVHGVCNIPTLSDLGETARLLTPLIPGDQS